MCGFVWILLACGLIYTDTGLNNNIFTASAVLSWMVYNSTTIHSSSGGSVGYTACDALMIFPTTTTTYYPSTAIIAYFAIIILLKHQARSQLSSLRKKKIPGVIHAQEGSTVTTTNGTVNLFHGNSAKLGGIYNSIIPFFIVLFLFCCCCLLFASSSDETNNDVLVINWRTAKYILLVLYLH